ncbi:MAG: hypothetical protein PHW46_03320 [Candidatus Omnitrophica bacterium]|nr:hypothetical protein [Candidatus Omnitrophota bacterium]
MKYRTVIEVVCDAPDPDSAIDIAGEYLRGDVDFGVEMKTKISSLRAYKMKKYLVSVIAMLFISSSLLLQFIPLSGVSNNAGRTGSPVFSTYTVMPSLNTKGKDDFRKEWDEKKGEAVLDYLKK